MNNVTKHNNKQTQCNQKYRKEIEKIEYFRDKLGEVIVDSFNEIDNSSYEIAKSVVSTFAGCKTESEFKAANNMLSAICGYNIESLIQEINNRDNKGYLWESV